MEERKNNSSVMVLVLISIIIILVIGFLYFITNQKISRVEEDLLVLEKKIDGINVSTGNSNLSSTNSAEQNTNNKCNGTLNSSYYGEYKDSIANIKQTYYFNSDGTYKLVVENGDGSAGTYMLKDSIITLNGSGPYPGSEFTMELPISDDCNTITAQEANYTMIFNKQ